MEVCLLETEVSDICIGKPALRSLSVSATVGDAVLALRRSDQSCLSIWSCGCGGDSQGGEGERASRIDRRIATEECRCVGKICTASGALVDHLQLNSRLGDALDLIQKGAQNLVVPIRRASSGNRLPEPPCDATLHHGGEYYCWLTHEDVLRFIFDRIARFSAVHDLPVRSLGIIIPARSLAVHRRDPAAPALARSLLSHAAVAVVDDDHRLIAEISPHAISRCDETTVAAVAALSVGELLDYIGSDRGPSEDLVRAVRAELERRRLGALQQLIEASVPFPSLPWPSSGEESEMHGRAGPARGLRTKGRRSEVVACSPTCSFLAVIYRALCNRATHVWVVEDDRTLAGIMTLAGMMRIFRQSMTRRMYYRRI